MGFLSLVVDYVESCLLFDEVFIMKFVVMYYMWVGEIIYRCGIMKDVFFVIDLLFKLCDGLLFICDCNGEFKVKRYCIYLYLYLENVVNGRKERLSGNDEGISGVLLIFGVIMYIINDVWIGEFDDCLVMQKGNYIVIL